MSAKKLIINTENKTTGSIQVICGPMFSGKTTQLISRLITAETLGLKVLAIKPFIDKRYADDAIVSHDAKLFYAHPVKSAADIIALAAGADMLVIDEAQFFDDELPDVCRALKNMAIQVIIAGLDMDFKGRPFGQMPALIIMADNVTKLDAICARCGKPAVYTYRLVPVNDKILLGEKEAYEARCETCFLKGRNA